jgi:hypothetical protein
MRSSLAEQDIRDIFSRMQNLNLLCLIEDLRHDNVATRRWISPLSLYERHTSDASYKLCPLAHGWPCAAQHNSDVQLFTADAYGISRELVHSFTSWWDNNANVDYGNVDAQEKLILLLKSILAERQEDADAVQDACCNTPLSDIIEQSS